MRDVQYEINDLGRTGALHCGRTLVPLLHLVIHAGEVGFTLQQGLKDHITPQMHDIYQHSTTTLVSLLWRRTLDTTCMNAYAMYSSVQLGILAQVDHPLDRFAKTPLIG
jgi:hypothetical protein